MIFLYEGLDQNSKLVYGVIDASSEQSALIRLQDKGYRISEIKPESFWSKFKKSLSSGQLTEEQSVQFFKEFLSILKAGLKPIESMEYMAGNNEEEKRFRYIAEQAYELMSEGDALPDALRQAGMKSEYCDVLSVGDRTGHVQEALASLIDQLELKIETNKGFKSIYVGPVLSIIVILLFTIGSILFLVPIQRDMIMQFVGSDESRIPLMSSISFWLGDYGIQSIVGFVLLLFVFIFFKRFGSAHYPSVAFFFDKLALKMPVFGGFYRNSEYSRICSMLMLAMSFGGRTDEVVSLIKDQSSSVTLQKRMQEVYIMVKEEGYMLSQALEEVHFNGIIVSTLKRGERSGTHESIDLMRGLSKEFSAKTLHNLEMLKSASDMINMIVLAVLSIPVLIITIAPTVDQVTLMLEGM